MFYVSMHNMQEQRQIREKRNKSTSKEVDNKL